MWSRARGSSAGFHGNPGNEEQAATLWNGCGARMETGHLQKVQAGLAAAVSALGSALSRLPPTAQRYFKCNEPSVGFGGQV